MYNGIHSEAGCLSGGLPEFIIVCQRAETVCGYNRQKLAEHQDPAQVGDESCVSVVAESQPVVQGAGSTKRAKLEAVPAHACLGGKETVANPQQVGHRLIGPTKQDGCPAVETGGEVEEVKEPNEDKSEGSDEPRYDC